MPLQDVNGSTENERIDKSGVENLRKEQRKDAELKEVIRWLEEPGDQPSTAVLRTYSPEIQQLWAQKQSLQMRAGILYRKFLRADISLRYWQIVVPRSLMMSFLDAVHSGAINGHPGVERTRLHLQKIAYWRGWMADTQMYVQHCHVCASHRPGPRRKQGHMQCGLACDIMQKVHVDLVGPFPTSQKGFKYLLTAICAFSKYLICVPIRDKISRTVAAVLMKQLYLVHGPPEILVHDQGGEFWSEVMRQLADLLEIQPTKITSHRPSANGVVERVHATLHSMFGKFVKRSQKDWCELVPYITYAYNTTIYTATGFSPFYLMHLRRVRVPIELLIGTPSEAAYESKDTYVMAASERMRKAYALVREQLQAGFDKAKKRYDSRVTTARFAVGDFVWYFVPRIRQALNRKWQLANHGPCRIVRKINDVNFVIKKEPRTREEIVHIDKQECTHREQTSADPDDPDFRLWTPGSAA